MSEMSGEIAVYCLNGHYMGTMPENCYGGLFPGRLRHLMEEQYIRQVERQNFCERCGAESMIACSQCEAVIILTKKRPDYCGKCGVAFPWVSNAAQEEDNSDDFEPLG